MNDDLTTLASSYLDGAVTADERARVEADTELLAEVERLRQVRAVLRADEPAPISMRERHLAAALDAWDRLPTPERMGLFDATPAGVDAAAVAGAASVTAPVSLEDRRRRRTSSRLLAVAAGLVVVLGGGLVARSVLRDADSTDTADSAAVADEPGELSQRSELEVLAADETFGGAESPLAEAPAAVESADDGGGQGESVIGSDEAPPDDGLVVLSSNEDLAIFADLLNRPGEVALDAAAESTPPTTPASASEPPLFDLCGLVDRVVGPAFWNNEGLFDIPVVVGINDERGEAIAYDDSTCNLIARTPLLES